MEQKVHPWFTPNMLVGTRLRGYQIQEFLGAGGFGAVYRTASPQGEPRAIKVLYPPHSPSGESLQAYGSRATRFLHEAMIAHSFNHSNIIKVYDTGQAFWHYQDARQGPRTDLDPSGDYLLALYVADYIPDGVDRRLKEGRLFTPGEALQIGRQVGDALQALHSASSPVLHLDLNPGNIRLAEDGRAVVADFGVARIEGVPGAYLTTEGPMIHRGISAPEQFTGEAPDVRTDIFQFGALLLVMLTDQFPRQGDLQLLTPDEMRSRLSQRGVSPGLAQIILKCLARDRRERFQDASELTAALEVGEVSGRTAAVRPSRPQRASLNLAWKIELPTTHRPGGAAPVAEGDRACYVWDCRNVHGVDLETGLPISNGGAPLTWPASDPPEKSTPSIQDSPECPPVQALGSSVYVRHARFLSCLDGADLAQKWRYEHGSDVTGRFLAAGDLLVLDSYHSTGSARVGAAALDPATGAVLWRLPESSYHVAGMAVAGDKLVLVESLGVAASGGMRVRLVELSSGVVMASHEVGRGSFGEFLSSTTTASTTTITRLHRPIITSGGSIVVWVSYLASPHLRALCFDTGLTLRWDKLFPAAGNPPTQSQQGSSQLLGAGGRLLAIRASRDDDGALGQGWVGGLDVDSGELVWDQQWRDNLIPTSAGVTPDGLIAFMVASQRARRKKDALRWQLMALDTRTGDELWKGPEQESPSGSVLGAPVVTSSHLYLQLPPKPAKNSGRLARVQGKGVLEAYRRV